MSLSAGLQEYIYGQANQQLAPYASLLGGAAKVGTSVNTNATATSGAKGQGGDISGGTAFNIGGINLGTQYPSAATAGGGTPSPITALSGGVSSLLPILAIGAVVVAVVLILRK